MVNARRLLVDTIALIPGVLRATGVPVGAVVLVAAFANAASLRVVSSPVVAWALGAAIILLALSWAQAAVLLDLGGHGTPFTIATARAATAYARRLVAANLLIAIGVSVVILVWAVISLLFPGGVLFFLAFIPALAAIISWTLAAPLIVLENKQALPALRQSPRMLHGSKRYLFVAYLALAISCLLVTLLATVLLEHVLPTVVTVVLAGFLGQSLGVLVLTTLSFVAFSRLRDATYEERPVVSETELQRWAAEHDRAKP